MAGSSAMPLARSFAMKVYATTYWLLAVLFVYILVVLILPMLAKSPETASFLPLILGFLVLFLAGAVAATFWPAAPRRRGVWLGFLIPPVLFLLLNAPFIPFPLTHPADISFTAIMPLLVGTIVLIVSGVIASREARSGAVAPPTLRARIAVAVVAGATFGAFVTSFVAANAGGGGAGSVSAAPTATDTLVAQNTKFVTTSYSMYANDVLGLFVENKDGFAHTFDVDSLNIHVQIPANTSVAVAIKPTGPGALQFYCSVPGHKEAGMAGSITVQ